MKKWHYLVLTLILSILEISFFPVISSNIPALGLLLAVLAALNISPNFGMITGILAGAIIDISLGFGLTQMALTYGLIAVGIGFLANHIIDLGLFTYLIATFVATLVSIFSATFFSLAFSYDGWQLALDLEIIGLKILVNLVSAIIIYILLRKKLSPEM
ncbi:MAG: hypothetical protein PHD88_00435 [Firmicutes bacterium]|nr:hypothetical protein [Bacillota bacterium]MDD4263247.1 hypothetical protein [Bacillota bacterium]MDD4692862.1 hypothetical protein [Bacillota bacterium]